MLSRINNLDSVEVVVYHNKRIVRSTLKSSALPSPIPPLSSRNIRVYITIAFATGCALQADPQFIALFRLYPGCVDERLVAVPASRV